MMKKNDNTDTTATSKPFATWPSLDDVRVENRVVLLRVDYNVAGDVNGELLDDFRLMATLPTLRLLRERRARTVILTHRGRPGGKVVPGLSTRPLAARLSELLGHDVAWAPDCIGRVAETAVNALAPGEILLLENTRFHLGEVLNQREFTQALARLGDVFVNDAFAAAHRAHASVTGLTAMMPEAVFGPLMLKELGWARALLDDDMRPRTVVVGGANVGQKFEMLGALLPRINHLLVGGVVANTMLAARDMGLGLSRMEPAFLEEARNLMTEAGVLGCRLQLPQDVLVTRSHESPEQARTVAAHQVAPDDVVRDVGEKTNEIWGKVVAQSRSLLWMGTVGAYEDAVFLKGTANLAEHLITQGRDMVSLVAGDGLLRALALAGVRDRLPRVSTAGTSLILILAGKPLPALQMMEKRTTSSAAA